MSGTPTIFSRPGIGSPWSIGPKGEERLSEEADANQKLAQAVSIVANDEESASAGKKVFCAAV
ncbi:hypothetical protein [Bosea sp. MMO-172]|uniref:hypothetical protein n=1 Tax=Bosea sp. MMO-172 TaxID=3127885 RepID=UPI0030185915